MSWTSGSLPAHRRAVALAAVLLSCSPLLAADLPAAGPPPAGLEASRVSLRPAADRPALSLAFPTPDRVFLPRIGHPAFAAPGAASPFLDLPQAARFEPDSLLRRLPGAGFPDRLMARMEREAGRYRRESLFDVAAGLDAEDSFGEDLRGREAERIITRAFDHVLDDQLERLARNGLGLGGVIDWLDDFGSSRHRSAATSGLPDGEARPRTPKRADASVGLRVGAHPRVVLRGEALGLKGSVEVPLLDEPLRLSVEKSFGPRGRAVLSSGLDRSGPDWAILSLNLKF